MKNKTRVVLTEPIDGDPYYSVQLYTYKQVWYWSTIRCISFRYNGDGIWSQERAQADALDLAKRLEEKGEGKETVVYQTDESLFYSKN